VKTTTAIIAMMGLSILLLSGITLASKQKPTCKERPEARNCVKVEAPDAATPKPSVYRNPNQPAPPVARPLPATAAPMAR